MYELTDIAAALGVEVVKAPHMQLSQIVTDSRKVYFAEQTIFFALRGVATDGHQYIENLYRLGVRCFVVHNQYAEAQTTDAVFFKVPDVLAALQALTAWHRGHFKIPIIGITGSNGKTIVKELLHQLLHQQFSIVRSPKSYNSQLGVPLSVWQLQKEHTLGIFEAGISTTGEMAALQKIINPTWGIFTYAGQAHAEGFSSDREKIREKLLLFAAVQCLIYNNDDEILHEEISAYLQKNNPQAEIFTWGYQPGATLHVTAVLQQNAGTTIQCHFKNEHFQFHVPFLDAAMLHNVITCCCVLLKLGWDGFAIQSKMPELKPIAMRLELKQGKNNCSVINDSYSSDFDALFIAIDFLMQQAQHPKRSVILSDILQTAMPPVAIYTRLAAMLQQKNLYRFIGVGNGFLDFQHLFEGIEKTHFFRDTDELIAALPSLDINHETILLKGARSFAFERIANVLEYKTHQTRLEINLDAVRHNLMLYRQLLQPGVKLMAMVKAFSYGSGSYEIANIMQYAGVEYVAVAYADEGVALRVAGIIMPIVVLNVDEESFSNVLKYKLQPELFCFSILERFINFLEEQHIVHYPVHIKLDTGMHRLGFMVNEIPALTPLLLHPCLKIESVFSHLVASDDPLEDVFTQQQFSSFTKATNSIAAALSYTFIKHLANTSAIARLPHLQMDMVRLGIGLYGIDANKKIQDQLRNVTTLKTTIAQIKRIKAGETVGYGRKGLVIDDSLIATVRIGYADGYRRKLGNGVGSMKVNGHFAPTIGNVCMDMTMINVTGIDVKEGDEVIVFGEELPVSTLASWGQTISYEILTNVSQRVKRVYFQE